MTRAPWEVVWEVQEWLDQGLISPRDLKRALAFRIVSDLDGLEAAVRAEADYDRVVRGELPTEMIEMELPRGTGLIEVLVRTGLASDEKEAKKRLAQGSVFVNGSQVKTDMEWLDDEGVVQIGKKTIGKIRRIRTI
ncbi:MAG: tyrosyl-tRNA synthetase [Microgenomates group bacterium ADurb.Bin238]|nr:MAG: tyrosyl-tRNA synthetase [Microgenomates group bacterium ADurb.Bin238]